MKILHFKPIKLITDLKFEDALINITMMTAYYIYLSIGCVATYIFFHFFAPQIFKYEYFDFWKKADFYGMYQYVIDHWLVFSTISIANFIFLLVGFKDVSYLSMPVNKFFAGITISVFAGISEEIVYRWLLFFASIGTIAFTDYFTGGFLFGHGFIYLGFVLTKFFVNIATFGTLNSYINSDNWLLGASMIVSAAKFREGHKNYGPLGYWFSWYFGLFTQVIVFNNGLLPAIVLHIFIDCFQDFLIFGNRMIKRSKFINLKNKN